MAKLVDILARELTSWQENDGGYGYCVHCHSLPTVIFGGPAGPLQISHMADDYKTAKVTRSEWQAARDALHQKEHDEAKVRKDELVKERNERIAKTWNGEGLPPVGSKCTIQQNGYALVDGHERFVGVTLTVVAQFSLSTGTEMVAVEGDPGLGCAVFRADMAMPIRTPDQIAADEKLNRVRAIESVMLAGQQNAMTITEIADLLDRAGYRKQEPK